jgi:hypothetical protein
MFQNYQKSLKIPLIKEFLVLKKKRKPIPMKIDFSSSRNFLWTKQKIQKTPIFKALTKWSSKLLKAKEITNLTMNFLNIITKVVLKRLIWLVTQKIPNNLVCKSFPKTAKKLLKIYKSQASSVWFLTN